MEQTQSRILDPVSERPVERTALATRPAHLDLGRIDLLDPDMADETALQALEKRALFRDKVIQLALARTSPSQYVVHRAEGDEARESVYPMGAAADAMFGFLGLTWAAPIPSVENGQEVGWRRGERKWDSAIRTVTRTAKDGTKVEDRYYWVRSALWTRDQLVALAEGKRLIGSGYAKDEPTAEIDAFENLKSRAVREVLGLKGKDRTWYLENGLDLSKARLAEFQDRKGSVSADPREATLPFGQAKGTKVASASDADLQWILPKIQESVADPKKARFKDANAALATAIQAELDRRAAKPTEDLQQAEEMERLIIAIKEEAASERVPEDKLEAHLKTLDTVEKLQATLDHYRKRREARAAKQKAPEPGSAG